MKKKIQLAVVMVSFVTAAALTSGTEASATGNGRKGVQARYQDHWIDLAGDWETATACAVGDSGAFCFTTEAEMDSYLAGSTVSAAAAGPVALAATCPSSLRLYDGTSYATPVLYLTTAGTYLNLYAFGFDNKTSSYRVGACDSLFYAGTSGGGSLYPTYLSQAYDQSPTMLSGWNNALSSVYIL